MHVVRVAERVGELGLTTCELPTESASRPDSLQRAGALGD